MATRHNMREFIKDQISWCKLFFAEDKVPNAPSHKNLLGITLVVIFAVAFLKKISGSPDIPDIPSGWQLVILGILGIRSIQSAVESIAEKKYGKDKSKESTNPS
jgi:hypothetical protein